MPRKKLFGVDIKDVKWGVGPGEHVAHLYVVGAPSMKEIQYQEVGQPLSGFEGVKQQEMYSNKGDNATALIFMDLAKKIAEDYEDEFLCEDKKYGKEYSKLLESFKAYLTSGRRSTQQKNLSELRKKISDFSRKISKDSDEEVREEIEPLNGEKPQEVATVLTTLKGKLSYFENTLNSLNKGNPDIVKGTLPDPLVEPDNTILGKAAVWVRTDDELFPHEPSPNDIKQGYGLEDCYMLSAMAVKAAKDPQFIKDMMKDNGDGTVTVRFYDKKKNPVDINVIKSVNKGPVGNNVYAAGSLWVQMLEKAYATYQTLTSDGVINGFSSNSPTQDVGGMKSIDRGTTDGFLNAIDSEKTSYTGSGRVETAGLLFEQYRFDGNGKKLLNFDRKTKGYPKFEVELFKVFDEHVNKLNEVITVGSSDGKGAGNLLKPDQSAFLKKHGIRTGHAYGIMKVFEKDGMKFVQLRDPYGSFKPEYGKDGKLKQNSYGPLAGGGSMVGGMMTAGNEDMGTFNVEFSDFLTYFKQFSGIKRETSNALSRVTKDRAIEMRDDLIEMAQPYTKEEETAQLEGLSEEEKKIYKQLTEDPFKLKKNISDSAKELKVTDEFFTWPNSSAFNKMRDQTYKLNKKMEKFEHIGATLEEKIKLAQEFTKLNKAADEYQAKKTLDLKKILDSGKKPSHRFVHRLTAAMSIRRNYQGQEKIAPWEKKNAEQMNIVMNDIVEKIDKMKQGVLTNVTTREIARMGEVVGIIKRTMSDNPKLALDSQIDIKEVDKVQVDLKQYDNLDNDYNMEMKKSENNVGELNRGNEINAEKNNNKNDFVMF